jgi:hypothetical protein
MNQFLFKFDLLGYSLAETPWDLVSQVTVEVVSPSLPLELTGANFPSLGTVVPLPISSANEPNAKLSSVSAESLLSSETPQAEAESPSLNTSLGTPGSDIFIYRDNGSLEIMFGRDGNDTLIGVQPIPYYPQPRPRVTVLFGDFQLTPEGIPTGASGEDTFVLGDWRNSYYQDFYPSRNGTAKFAVVGDFNAAEDVIQLKGSKEDYVLIPVSERSTRYNLFQLVGEELDLIAAIGQYSVANPSELSLDGAYFEFEGTAPDPIVAETFFQLGTAGYETLTDIHVDVNGNVYISGQTSGSLSVPNTNGNLDGVFQKYNGQGKNQWEKQIDGGNLSSVLGIASDKVGENVYIVGNTLNGNVGGPPVGEEDVFLISYNAATGAENWRTQFGTDDIDVSWAIDTDSQNNLVLSGYSIFTQEDGTKSDDSWVTKYDSAGNRLWFASVSSGEFDEAYAVATDAQDNVFAAGWTLGQLGEETFGTYDNWLVKYNANGDRQWIEQFGTSSVEFPWDMAIDSQGNAYVTGWTFGTFEGQQSFGYFDAFLAKYSNDGDQLWIKHIGTAGDDGAWGIDIDAQDNVYITGYTNRDLSGISSGDYDAWVNKYDGTGAELWATQFGTAKTDQGRDVQVDRLGNVYVTGLTSGSLGELNQGSFDGFITKLEASTGELVSFEQNRPRGLTAPLAPALGSSNAPISLSQSTINSLNRDVSQQLADIFAQNDALGSTLATSFA